MIATTYVPGTGSGRAARTYGLVRALLRHGDVDLAWVPFGGQEVASRYRDLDGLRLHRVDAIGRLRRGAAYARLRARGVPAAVARGVSPGLAAEVGRLASAADRVVADDPAAAVSLWTMAGRRPVVYSAHNLEHRFRRDWGRPDRVRRFESRLLERFAEVWMPSPADTAGAADLAPRTTVRYVPNVVDVAAIPPVGARARRVLLVADFTYAPNREGLGWLLERVLPRLAADIEVVVVGRGLDPPPTAPLNVRFLGFVDDLEAVYAGVGCAVVPLLTGGGSPLKFVEAMAHALPVVATPRAAAGLEVTPGAHYLEGETPEQFARAVDRALDPRYGPEVGRAARALAELEYSIDALAARTGV